MATYHVATTGNDANSGADLAHAKRNVGTGVGLLSPGDTLEVHVGTYVESLLDTIPGGTSGARVTVAASGSDVVVLRPGPGQFVLNFGVAHGSATQYITIDRLTLDAVNCTNDCIKIESNGSTFAHHIRVQNSIIKNAGGNGALIFGQVGGNEFLSNEVTGNATAFFSTGRGHGFYIASSNNWIDGNVIHGNSFGNFSSGLQVYNSGHSDHDDNIISRNLIYDHAYGDGIILGSGHRNLAINNVLIGNPLKIGFGSESCAGYNNTIVGCSGYAVQIGQAASSLVRNNVFGGNGVNDVDLTASADPSPVINKNVTDAVFIDAGASDYRLAPGSSGLASGVDLSAIFTKDFNNAVRTAPWSVGAFISGSAPVDTPGVIVPPVVVIPPVIVTPSGIVAPPPIVTPGGSAFVARGGLPPYTFSIGSGSLPPGLTLNANGTLTGTPTLSGTFSFTVNVSDSHIPPQTDSKSCQIVIQPASPALSYDSLFAFEMLDYGLTSAISGLGFPFAFVVSTTRLDQADFDGDLWYFEIVATNNHASIPYNVLLVDGAGATKATIAVPANLTAPTIYRSSSFALTAGESDYQVKMPASAANGNVWVRTARMLVQLTSATKAVSAYPLTMNNNLSGTNAEGSIVGIGATARFDSSPTDVETAPEHFSIFRFTAAHWSTIAEYELQLVYQTNGSSQALVFGLFDVSTGIEVSGSHIAMPSTGAALPEFLTLTIPAGALTDGREYELRGSEPGVELCYLYKARLHLKLTALARAEAYLMVSKETAVLNTTTPEARHTFGSTLYGSARSIYLEAVGSVSGTPGNFRGDLIDDGANTSGTAGSGVSGGSLAFTTTKARVRSSALPLGDAHYTWKQTRSTGGDSMTTTIAFILVVVQWS